MVTQADPTTVIIQPQPYAGKVRAGIYVSTLYEVKQVQILLEA